MQLNIDALNEEFRDAPADAVLRWAARTFGSRLAATSSFQTQSLPLLHLISRHTPELRVLFLDTGFHFPDTLAYRDKLIRDLGLNVDSLTPQMGHAGFMQRYGQLYSKDPDMCCFINKVEPLERARRELDAWISGIRRDQTPARSDTPVIALQADGSYKIAPLAYWTQQDVEKYIDVHALPEHPLRQAGYRSVGCSPCTRAVDADADYREGRWSDSGKTECGLHADYFEKRQQALKSEENQ